MLLLYLSVSVYILIHWLQNYFIPNIHGIRLVCRVTRKIKVQISQMIVIIIDSMLKYSRKIIFSSQSNRFVFNSSAFCFLVSKLKMEIKGLFFSALRKLKYVIPAFFEFSPSISCTGRYTSTASNYRFSALLEFESSRDLVLKSSSILIVLLI